MANKYEDALVDLLKQVKEVFDRHGIIFWLDCGTLLGAVREGKLLEWDNDVDLGAWDSEICQDTKRLIANDLRNRGLNVGIFYTFISIEKDKLCVDLKLYKVIHGNAVEAKFLPRNRVGKFLNYFSKALLVTHFIRINDARGNAYRYIQGGLIYLSNVFPQFLRKKFGNYLRIAYENFGAIDVTEVVPVTYFSSFVTISFYSNKFRVPKMKEQYLSYRYGEDWKIPQKEWITERDDKSVVSCCK